MDDADLLAKMYPTMPPAAPETTSDTDATLANKFYPTMAAPGTATEDTMRTKPNTNDTAPADPNTEAADKLFKGKPEPQAIVPPEGIEGLRVQQAAADPTAAKLYPPGSEFVGVIPDGAYAHLEGQTHGDITFTPELIAGVEAEQRRMLADNGLNSDEGKQVVDLFKQVGEAPPSDEQVAEWEASSRAWLRDQYGPKANEMLALANRLIARDPRIKAIIRQTPGVGSHPRMVRIVVDAAVKEKAKGRLK